MLRRNEIITVILAVVTPSLFFTDPAFAQLSCSDVNRDNPAYHEKIVNISVKQMYYAEHVNDADRYDACLTLPLW